MSLENNMQKNTYQRKNFGGLKGKIIIGSFLGIYILWMGFGLYRKAIKPVKKALSEQQTVTAAKIGEMGYPDLMEELSKYKEAYIKKKQSAEYYAGLFSESMQRENGLQIKIRNYETLLSESTKRESEYQARIGSISIPGASKGRTDLEQNIIVLMGLKEPKDSDITGKIADIIREQLNAKAENILLTKENTEKKKESAQLKEDKDYLANAFAGYVKGVHSVVEDNVQAKGVSLARIYLLKERIAHPENLLNVGYFNIRSGWNEQLSKIAPEQLAEKESFYFAGNRLFLDTVEDLKVLENFWNIDAGATDRYGIFNMHLNNRIKIILPERKIIVSGLGLDVLQK